MATFDPVISATARSFLESLSEFERIEFFWALDNLCEDPYPDGTSKVPLDFFPHTPGTFAFTSGEFWITYTFLNEAVIGIASVYWKPDSPRRRGELDEI